MVYCPEIYPESFVHLSIRGESYAIRAFTGSKKFDKWKQPGMSRTSELLAHYRFVHTIDVSGTEDRVNLKKEE